MAIFAPRATGVYLMVDDQSSNNPITIPSGARLLVISSKKGVVNKIVPVADFKQYTKMFDGISRKDERNGNFSARSAEYMLATSPILVLNLRSFDDTKDLAGKAEISTSTTFDNGEVDNTVPYSSFFSKNQFWNVDPTRLRNVNNNEQLLVLGNVGNKKSSVFIRKSQTNQSSLTFADWYANLGRQIPGFVNPEDKVADWYVDVFVFNNDFSSASKNAGSNAYGYLFDSNGLRKTVRSADGTLVDGLEELSKIVEAGFVASYTGSLIPNFTDESNRVKDIVQLINADVNNTGLIAAVNKQIFDAADDWEPALNDPTDPEFYYSDNAKKQIPVDMLGHSLCHINEVGAFDEDRFAQDALGDASIVEMMSYRYKLTTAEFVQETDETVGNEALNVADDAVLTKITNAFLPGVSLFDGSDHVYEVDNSYAVGSVLYFLENAKASLGQKFVGQDGNLSTINKIEFVGRKSYLKGLGTLSIPVMPSSATVFDDGDSGSYSYSDEYVVFPKVGGLFVYPADHPLAGQPIVADISTSKIVHNPNDTDAYLYQKNADGTDAVISFPSAGYSPAAEELIEVTISEIEGSDVAKAAEIRANYGLQQNIYKAYFDKPVALNKASVKNVAGELDAVVSPTPDDSFSIVLDNGNVLDVFNNDLAVFKVADAHTSSSNYQSIVLNSYTLRKEQFVDGTAKRQNEILDVMLESSMKKALCNRDLEKFVYIVDPFKTYIEPNAKYQFAEIGKARMTVDTISSMPFMEDFENSTDPYFQDSVGGEFNPKYIASGGNLQLPYTNSFSLPDSAPSHIWFFGPGLKVLDSGESFVMPAAPVVSNNFANKYRGGNVYDIIVGPGVGSISGKGIVDVEYKFNPSNDGTGDLDILEPFGYNPIVNKSTGLQIYGNRTAQNKIETTLSLIHAREILKYIQLQMIEMLEPFVGKYRTVQNRLIIKTKADEICQPIFLAGALYDFNNIIDNTNNTDEIINASQAVLDTTLVINKGMNVIVQRTTLNDIDRTISFQVS